MLTKILIIFTLTFYISVNVKAYNFEYLVLICPPETDGQPVFIPNVDCTKYYECSHGRPILMQCPAGLYFNPILNVCDHKENSGCNQTNNIKQARLQRSNDGYVYIPHENRSKFYKCLNDNCVELQCPQRLHFNTIWNRCDNFENNQL